MDLPQELRLGLERELRTGGRRVGEAAAALSAQYRGSGRASGPLDDAAALAYGATRMPATYAATAAALAALAEAAPELRPRSLLDVGAGTGAAMWAAAEVWDSLGEATLLERDRAMLALGRRLAAGSRRAAIAGAAWQAGDLTASWQLPPHDLVTAAYVLGELSETARVALVARLWGLAEGALLLIEPGTPRGWATIRAAREQLRTAGATLAAPCPQQGLCPMPEHDWCHFAQRVARSRLHREAKGGQASYEDEKFSYVAVCRGPTATVAARVLRHPLVRPGRIELSLCTPPGLRRATATRSAATAWRAARNTSWGDGLGPEVLEEL